MRILLRAYGPSRSVVIATLRAIVTEMKLANLLLVAPCAVAVSLLSASRAEASPTLAADVDVAVPIDQTGASTGFGGALRFGYQIRLPLIAVTPEVGVAYHFFGDDFGPKAFRGFAGGRLGIGEGVRPGIYAHVGFGNVSIGEVTVGSAKFPGVSHTSSALDAGVFLDFTLLPKFDLGVHGGYNTIQGEAGALKWITAGVHVAYIF